MVSLEGLLRTTNDEARAIATAARLRGSGITDAEQARLEHLLDQFEGVERRIKALREELEVWLGNLSAGDAVEAWIGGRWRLAEVVAVARRCDPILEPCLTVREAAAGRKGGAAGARPKTACEIRPPGAGAFRAEGANVFADWLDDHGEPAAAAKLRAAFPLVAAGGLPKST